jgi:ribosomal protein L28
MKDLPPYSDLAIRGNQFLVPGSPTVAIANSPISHQRKLAKKRIWKTGLQKKTMQETPERFRLKIPCENIRTHDEYKRKLAVGTDSYFGLIRGCIKKIASTEKLKLIHRTEMRQSARLRLLGYKKFSWKGVRADATGQWFRKYAGQAADGILNFCKTHGILKEVKRAVNLAEKCFQPFVVRLEEYIDPETDDKQVMIALSVRGKSREEVLAAYHSYTQQSINILPWPKSNLIGLSYDIS